MNRVQLEKSSNLNEVFNAADFNQKGFLFFDELKILAKLLGVKDIKRFFDLHADQDMLTEMQFVKMCESHDLFNIKQ